MAVKENFRNYIRRAGPTGDPSRGMVILGNGPSLSDDLPRLIARREYEAKDFMAVNFFAEDDRFEVVRPGYYVLSDPMFFRDSECRDRVAALYRTLDSKVTWPMTLYVQFYNPEKFDYRAALPNPRIRIVRFHTPRAPQPIYMKVPHVPYTMSVYLAEVAELFRGHEVLRDYAASLGARIVNRTRGSMIDAYERGAE